MPSSRRLRVVAIGAFLAVLTLLYVTTGARNTYNSQFYTSTVDAINSRHDAEARQNLMAEEKQRLDRVERVQKEHDAAVSKGAVAAAEHTGTAHADPKVDQQKPLEADPTPSEKSIAGRKKMKDERIVGTKPEKDGDDGVAKVGNVQPKASSAQKADTDAESEEEREVEGVINDILKKGPIIIFSKSYCPHSKKAKHILLDMYTINPHPYVVELDEHELGPALQNSLFKTTGRKTVPNVLINGKSIGGGDDIAALHRDGKLIDTVTSMAGKRITEIKANEPTDRNQLKF
ncbi:Hypothetical protein R9X50_00246500 [Acrodontium crateriforme]|uniref:Glutaredoxin domain-containing protein n=1 Tax=Acrodontium crateriforme TaxID=150365 RepID=A0AAQ3M278_9PEZI|nr:Hypothetical protein R9X50_00246500 [Acrodontium crateriforme]